MGGSQSEPVPAAPVPPPPVPPTAASAPAAQPAAEQPSDHKRDDAKSGEELSGREKTAGLTVDEKVTSKPMAMSTTSPVTPPLPDKPVARDARVVTVYRLGALPAKTVVFWAANDGLVAASLRCCAPICLRTNPLCVVYATDYADISRQLRDERVTRGREVVWASRSVFDRRRIACLDASHVVHIKPRDPNLTLVLDYPTAGQLAGTAIACRSASRRTLRRLCV